MFFRYQNQLSLTEEPEWKYRSEPFGHVSFFSLLHRINFVSFNRRSSVFARVPLQFPEIITLHKTSLSLFECFLSSPPVAQCTADHSNHCYAWFFQQLVILLIFGEQIFLRFSFMNNYSHLLLLPFQILIWRTLSLTPI